MAFDLQGMLSHTISAASLHDQDRIELNQKCCCVALTHLFLLTGLSYNNLSGREMPDLKKKLKYTCFQLSVRTASSLSNFYLSRTQRQKYSIALRPYDVALSLWRILLFGSLNILRLVITGAPTSLSFPTILLDPMLW